MLGLISKPGKLSRLQDQYFKRSILCLYISKKKKKEKERMKNILNDLLQYYKNIKYGRINLKRDM